MKLSEKQLKFKAKEGFKLTITGTNIELESIYMRTRWNRSLNGKKIEVQCNVYLSKEKFFENENKTLSVDIMNIESKEQVSIPPIGNYGIHSIPENYDQNDLAYSHQIVNNELLNYLEIDS